MYELRAWAPDVQSGGTARGIGNSSEQKEKAVQTGWTLRGEVGGQQERKTEQV